MERITDHKIGRKCYQYVPFFHYFCTDQRTLKLTLNQVVFLFFVSDLVSHSIISTLTWVIFYGSSRTLTYTFADLYPALSVSQRQLRVARQKTGMGKKTCLFHLNGKIHDWYSSQGCIVKNNWRADLETQERGTEANMQLFSIYHTLDLNSLAETSFYITEAIFIHQSMCC